MPDNDSATTTPRRPPRPNSLVTNLSELTASDSSSRQISVSTHIIGGKETTINSPITSPINTPISPENNTSSPASSSASKSQRTPTRGERRFAGEPPANRSRKEREQWQIGREKKQSRSLSRNEQSRPVTGGEQSQPLSAVSEAEFKAFNFGFERSCDAEATNPAPAREARSPEDTGLSMRQLARGRDTKGITRRPKVNGFNAAESARDSGRDSEDSAELEIETKKIFDEATAGYKKHDLAETETRSEPDCKSASVSSDDQETVETIKGLEDWLE